MDWPSLYAIGAFIQAPPPEPRPRGRRCRSSAPQAHVYVGTGLGNIGKLYDASIELHHAQRRWDRFWSEPERNSALRKHLAAHGSDPVDGVPPAPAAAAAVHAEPDAREAAVHAWWRYWADRSPELAQYLRRAGARSRRPASPAASRAARCTSSEPATPCAASCSSKWGAPDAPWEVSANVVWNIHNTPAAQISMLGNITGLAFAPVAACSTFGVALKLGMDAIRRGEAKAVVVGATDPPPHPLIVGGFFSARVLAADGRVSLPLTAPAGHPRRRRLGGLDPRRLRLHDGAGFRPLGMEPIAVGVSSDADHIITPTLAGRPRPSSRRWPPPAPSAGDIGTWDLHATATPGDYQEVEAAASTLPPDRAR